ncbi:MAG TPA: DUF4145 domain-containing protein [Patescibacteria group bacterium]
MYSWWDLGESSGHLGNDLALYLIECPFCEVKGNFELAFHGEKTKPNGRKVLNFDTYKCGNCAGFVQVTWSAGEYSHGPNRGMHAFIVQPWPKRVNQAPEHWPLTVSRFWKQAHQSLKSETWDAAAIMSRSALQAIMKDKRAKGNNLEKQIDDLAEKGILPQLIKDWAHELRLLGNKSAHPKSDEGDVDPQNVKDIIKFLDFMLKYTYDLPKEIDNYRDRHLNA